jgi:cell division protein FtsB
MEKIIQDQIHDNQSSVYIRITMNQIIGFIITFVLLLSPLVYGAGNYATQFEYIKKEVIENKQANSELTKSVQELTLEIRSLRTGLENVNKR